MNPLVLGILRHGLTLAGGVLVARGYGNDETVQQIVGGLVSAASVGWMAWDKRRAVIPGARPPGEARL